MSVIEKQNAAIIIHINANKLINSILLRSPILYEYIYMYRYYYKNMVWLEDILEKNFHNKKATAEG